MSTSLLDRLKSKEITAPSWSLPTQMLSVDLYNQKNQVRLGILIVLALLALGTFYYTNNLIRRLEAHEEEEIRLYAKGMQYALTSDFDEDVNFFFNEIVRVNTEIPVILVDSKEHILGSRNIPYADTDTTSQLREAADRRYLVGMKTEHDPIELDTGLGEKQFMYYSNSFLSKQLQYYPLVQLAGLLIFGYLGFLAFSSARRAEQNRVWVGLAKETAHQLGTPLSSLTAWVEYFKTDPKYDPDIVTELEKDIQRLDTITTRFSNIGSVPTLKPEPVSEAVTQFISYLQKRISSKVKVFVDDRLSPEQTAPMNRYLFEWVIENLCKNAVDAMNGTGELRIKLQELKGHQIAIDISDTGKGITKAHLSKVFSPGFSTKKRGWGLGLTLAKRIVENYHNGKLFVKQSEVGKGTTFRIVMPTGEEV